MITIDAGKVCVQYPPCISAEKQQLDVQLARLACANPALYLISTAALPFGLQPVISVPVNVSYAVFRTVIQHEANQAGKRMQEVYVRLLTSKTGPVQPFAPGLCILSNCSRQFSARLATWHCRITCVTQDVELIKKLRPDRLQEINDCPRAYQLIPAVSGLSSGFVYCWLLHWLEGQSCCTNQEMCAIAALHCTQQSPLVIWERYCELWGGDIVDNLILQLGTQPSTIFAYSAWKEIITDNNFDAQELQQKEMLPQLLPVGAYVLVLDFGSLQNTQRFEMEPYAFGLVKTQNGHTIIYNPSNECWALSSADQDQHFMTLLNSWCVLSNEQTNEPVYWRALGIYPVSLKVRV